MMDLDSNIMLLFTVLVFLGLFVILCFILCMICLGKVHKINKINDEALTQDDLYDFIDQLRGETKIQESVTTAADPNAFCKFAVVKFNAFDDITGEYSFSVALLNSFNDGIILSSLYGHNSCNTYIRKVHQGNCETYLLEEEKEALENALSGKG